MAEGREDAGRPEAVEDRYWELEDEIGSPLDCALRYATGLITPTCLTPVP